MVILNLVVLVRVVLVVLVCVVPVVLVILCVLQCREFFTVKLKFDPDKRKSIKDDNKLIDLG